jgi:hypothetical protein
MIEACSELHAGRMVRNTLASYLRDSNERQMVSARNAIAHIRTALPELKYSDGRLTDIIAGAIIIADLDVDWDGQRSQPLYGRRRNGPIPCRSCAS